MLTACIIHLTTRHHVIFSYFVCFDFVVSCLKVVRRWVNEVTEGVSSQHEMVQYHALSLLYQIKAHDKLAVSKLVRQLLQQQSAYSHAYLGFVARHGHKT